MSSFVSLAFTSPCQKTMLQKVLLFYTLAHFSSNPLSRVAVYNNGQVMDGGDPVGVFSGWNFASIANKVLIVVSYNCVQPVIDAKKQARIANKHGYSFLPQVIVIFGIIAAVVAYKYFRIQQKRAKLNRYG